MNPLLRAPLAAALLAATMAAPASPQTVAEARALAEAGHAAEAEALLRDRLRAAPADHQAAYHLALLLLERDEPREAQDWLERAVKAAPDSARYHAALGNAYGAEAQDAGMLRQARLAGRIRDAFEAAVRLDSTLVQPRIGLIQFHLAAPGIMGGDREEALRQARTLHRIDPWAGWAWLANVHNALEQTDEAERVVRDAAAAFPDSAAPVVSLALQHHRHQRWDDAVALLRPLATREPPDPGALYQLGRTGALSGLHLDEAEAALRRYLTIDPPSGQPPHAAAHWRLGMILEHRGRTDDARAEYRAALRLDPDHEEATKALQRLGG